MVWFIDRLIWRPTSMFVDSTDVVMLGCFRTSLSSSKERNSKLHSRFDKVYAASVVHHQWGVVSGGHLTLFGDITAVTYRMTSLGSKVLLLLLVCWPTLAYLEAALHPYAYHSLVAVRLSSNDVICLSITKGPVWIQINEISSNNAQKTKNTHRQ